MILLEPMGGLANRMRVIASGIWLIGKLKTELVVIWNENYELNCPYNLLFEESGIFSVRQKVKKYNYIKTSNQITLSKKLSTKIINKLIGIDYCIQELDFYNLIWTGKLDIYEAAKKHRVTYIQTCQEFGDNLFAFQYFKPILQIKEKIDLVIKNFTAYTIGVHIRRKDHINSIQYSPLELFINKMQAELEAEKNTSFFLCTDDLEVENTIVSIFGNNIISYKKELSRQSVQGIQGAVVDLFCLSKTKKILGSYWSSYGDIGSRLNHIELEVLKSPV